MTSLPAVVTIGDLPTGTTISGAELLMAVQTASGVGNSIQVPISQIMTTALGGLPTGGGTGQVLQKTNASNFVSNWVNPSSFIAVGTGLALAGSTSLTLSFATAAGPSVLGVAGTSTAAALPIVGTGAQVLRVNDAGTGLAFGAVNLGSAAAVTGVLPNANYSAVNLGSTGAGGVQGFLPGTSIATAGVSTTQLQTAAGLSVLAVNSSGATNFSVISGTAGQVLAVNLAGTGVAFQGGAVLLNTILPNNVATAGDTTSLTSAFRNYLVTLENVVPATSANPGFQVQIATTGTAFQAASYVSTEVAKFGNESSVAAIMLSGALSTTGVGNGTTYGVSGDVLLAGPAGTIARKVFTGKTSWLIGTASATANFNVTTLAGYWDGGNNAVTGLQFSFTAGNIQTGIIRIYGLA